MLVFRAGDARWAVEIDRVVEILDVVKVTRLPGLPEWIPGLLDHRGRLVPVVDLRRLSGTATAGREATIVVADGEREIAITADGVESTESIDPATVEPDAERPWTSGTANGITILDPRTLLEVTR